MLRRNIKRQVPCQAAKRQPNMLTLLRPLAAVVLLTWSLAAGGQAGTKVYVIGWLSATAVSSPESMEAFRQSLREFGWIEGRNFILVF